MKKQGTTDAKRAAANDRQEISRDVQGSAELVSKLRAEIYRFSPGEWPARKPFEFVVYPTSFSGGVFSSLAGAAP